MDKLNKYYYPVTLISVKITTLLPVVKYVNVSAIYFDNIVKHSCDWYETMTYDQYKTMACMWLV